MNSMAEPTSTTTDHTRSFSQRLATITRDAIKDAGYSRRDIAEATGIAVNTLGRRLTGRSPFYLTELGVIARELGVKVSDLIAAAEADAA